MTGIVTLTPGVEMVMPGDNVTVTGELISPIAMDQGLRFAVREGGKTVGFSMFGGYSYNERMGLSLGVVDAGINVGEELALTWGEENGGTSKPPVERHVQTEVRVRVAAVPYSRAARESYAEGWRTRKA